MSGAGSGPLSRVLEVIEGGATGRLEIARAAGISPQTAAAALDQLERLGRIRRDELGSGCADGGCGSCPVASGCAGTPGRGPVALTLTRRPR